VTRNDYDDDDNNNNNNNNNTNNNNNCLSSWPVVVTEINKQLFSAKTGMEYEINNILLHVRFPW
jgi:hypothetical protein